MPAAGPCGPLHAASRAGRPRSCATRTPRAGTARASTAPRPTSTARSRRPCAAGTRRTRQVDAALIELDGTATKSRLGANAVLGVFLAAAKAAAAAHRLSLHRFLGGADAHLLPRQNVDYPAKLIDASPVVSIEDPMAENDLDGWRELTARVGDRCRLTGDDVFCTSQELLREGIRAGVGNSVLAKANQIGTLTEALAMVATAHRAGWTGVMSHRSGETDDTTIADLPVATGCGRITTGSLSRSDRTAKYDQLIRIEEESGGAARCGNGRGWAPTQGGRVGAQPELRPRGGLVRSVAEGVLDVFLGVTRLALGLVGLTLRGHPLVADGPANGLLDLALRLLGLRLALLRTRHGDLLV